MKEESKQAITLIKVGGAKLVSATDLSALAAYVCHLRGQHQDVVIVHGGGPEISRLHHALDLPFEKRDGIRVTKGQGMDVAQMVLCGLVNKRLVAHCVSAGVSAVGVSGVDAGLLRVSLLDEASWGRVGREPKVDDSLLRDLLASDRVPIVAPISLGQDGAPVNVNADDAAHAIATALRVDSMEFVSDIPGVKDGNDEVIARIDDARFDDLVTEQVVQGGMIPKLQAALIAIEEGVGRVRIGDLAAMEAQTATEVMTA